MQELRIVGYSMDVAWKQKQKNFLDMEDALNGVDADLIVLPEMFSTGFCMDPEEIADRSEESLSWMKTFAQENNVSIAGSVSAYENKNYYNRLYFVQPNGQTEYYDKRHLFSYSKENENYSKGYKRVIVSLKGVRVLLQICYDLRFPVFSRNRNDYDLALYVANWPKPRTSVWEALLKARAIENQAYVFGLNRVGTDGNDWEYEGKSACYFPDGSLFSTQEGDLVKAQIDLQKLNDYRNEYRFSGDADDFDLKF